MLSKKALAIFFIIFGIIAAVMFTWNKMSPPKDSPPLIDNSNWKPLSYPELGISLSVPPEFAEEENGEYSRIFTKISERSDTPKPSFIYFSVVPRGSEIFSGEIYNYDPRVFQAMVSMQVGEETVMSESPNEDAKKYFSYRKLDNITIGGYGTKSFINTSPWEFPSGTTEYRFIIEFGNVNYIIGGYLNVDVSSPYYISRDEFNKILDTVKFNPEAVKPANPASQSADWNNFTDEIESISLKYPKNWQVRTDSQNFPEGDLFSAGITGQTQRTQTELYDGASFAVMKPVISEKEVLPWMEEKYLKEPVDAIAPVFSEETFGNKTYRKSYVCGLGCFSYYHFKENGKIYGFVFFAEGPDKETYASNFRKIMESINFNPFPS